MCPALGVESRPGRLSKEAANRHDQAQDTRPALSTGGSCPARHQLEAICLVAAEPDRLKTHTGSNLAVVHGPVNKMLRPLTGKMLVLLAGFPLFFPLWEASAIPLFYGTTNIGHGTTNADAGVGIGMERGGFEKLTKKQLIRR